MYSLISHPRRAVQLLAALAATGILATAVPARAATDITQFSVTPGSLTLSTAPDVPSLPALTLTGQAQTLNATMPSWTTVDATGSGSGWNLQVQGDSSGSKSAVFKEYCTDGTATNGCNTAVGGGAGPGYVSSGATMAADSLTLTSTSASFNGVSGTTGSAPTHSCGSGCSLDAASPLKIASAATNAGMGTWQATGYTASSLALSAPTSIKAIGTGNKVYRVDLLWTLSTGP